MQWIRNGTRYQNGTIMGDMAMYENYFFDLYGTLVDIRTDEGKLSLWRGVAEFYSLCGAAYTAAEIQGRCARQGTSGAGRGGCRN